MGIVPGTGYSGIANKTASGSENYEDYIKPGARREYYAFEIFLRKEEYEIKTPIIREALPARQ